MKGQPDVIATLNDVLTAEYTSVHQYMLAAERYARWGYERLHEKTASEVQEELGHVREVIERITFLEGAADVQALGRVQVGDTVTAQLRADLGIESAHVERLNRGIALARDKGDNGTVELLERVLRDTEEHVDFLETQLTLVTQVGEAHYLAQQIKKGG